MATATDESTKDPVIGSLKIDLQSLESAPPVEFAQPKQIAVYSTKIRDSTEYGLFDVGQEDEVDDILSKYTVQEPYRRTLHSDRMSSLNTISFPRNVRDVSFDLTKGFGTQIEKELENEFLGLLLECLTQEDLLEKSEFVCLRRLLTAIGGLPYDAGAGGEFDFGNQIAVQKIGSVFYMWEFPTTELSIRQENLPIKLKLLDYGGLKFESYLTAKPGKIPIPSRPMDFNLEFASVVESKIGLNSLTYRGGIDCFFPQKPQLYVELKTHKRINFPNQEQSFRRYKMFKWWLQCSLVGIEDVLCGYRGRNNIVRTWEWFKVSQLPGKMGPRPSACLAFIDQFLNFVKDNVVTELEPYIIERHPSSLVLDASVDSEC